ncbi:MAG: hypothetical protein JXD23_09330 [Spirochaetales bacterium]|nr:hypothetical protein [Spirochaetales bacterium]
MDMEEKTAEIECFLNRGWDGKRDFTYRYDLTPREKELLSEWLPAFGKKLAKAARRLGVAGRGAELSLSWNIRTALSYLNLGLEEIDPKRLRGYGGMSESAETELRSELSEISASVKDILTRLPRVDEEGRYADDGTSG